MKIFYLVLLWQIGPPVPATIIRHDTMELCLQAANQTQSRWMEWVSRNRQQLAKLDAMSSSSINLGRHWFSVGIGDVTVGRLACLPQSELPHELFSALSTSP